MGRICSPTNQIGIGDRSLDRVSAGASKGQSNVPILQSRAELLQNEYKKVIENHPGTIVGRNNGSAKYDDTDLLSRMFQKDCEGTAAPLGLNRCESSSEVLHKSQSLKNINDLPSTLAANNNNQTSIAQRMLNRKTLIAQST